MLCKFTETDISINKIDFISSAQKAKETHFWIIPLKSIQNEIDGNNFFPQIFIKTVTGNTWQLHKNIIWRQRK